MLGRRYRAPVSLVGFTPPLINLRVGKTSFGNYIHHTLPVLVECWHSVSTDFVFGFPTDTHTNICILMFVDWFSKIIHLTAVPGSITAQGCACISIDTVFQMHG